MEIIALAGNGAKPPLCPIFMELEDEAVPPSVNPDPPP